MFQFIPNPASESINVNGVMEGSDILFINANGQTLQSKKANNEVVNFEVSQYSSGIYFLVIRDGNTSIRKKVIISK